MKRMWGITALFGFLFGFGAPSAVAGELRAVPGAWLGAWDWDPLVLFNLGACGILYGTGLRRLWSRVGLGGVVRRWQAMLFGTALLLIALVLLSPLDALAADLSSAHMVQHMILMMVAAPLFVLGAPGYVVAWAFRREWPRWLVCEPWLSRLLWNPWLTWSAATGVLWLWHHPLCYQAALRDPLVHDAQHLSFFGSALLFWRVTLEPLARRRRLHPAIAVPYLFAASLQATVLGVFMALAPSAWYDDYARTTALWGLAPLEDQQLAGLIMWVPGCLVYPAVAVAVFGTWLAGAAEGTHRLLIPPRRSLSGAS